MGFTPEVFPRVLNEASWAIEGLLDGFEILANPQNGKSRYGDSSARNASTTIDHVKAKSIRKVILLGLVYFHDYVLLGLRCVASLLIDLRPIEHAEVVELGLVGQHVVLSQRSLRRNRSDFVDHPLLCFPASERDYARSPYLRTFFDEISDLEAVLVLIDRPCRLAE